MTQRVVAIDTETTGRDLRHGCKPFLVSIYDPLCDPDPSYYVWDVDPETRQPDVCVSDLKEIIEIIEQAEILVLQNPRFDKLALETVLPPYLSLPWDWSKVRDTLFAGHLLASNHPHDLSSMAVEYLGISVEKYEKALEKAVKEARKIAKDQFPKWKIARSGLKQIPSAKDGQKIWKNDYWLPRALTIELDDEPEEHPWDKVCSAYACADSSITYCLWEVQLEKLRSRGLEKIYLESIKLLPPLDSMESSGITLNAERLKQQIDRYRRESQRAGRKCISIASKHGAELELPKSGNNKSLLSTVFDSLQLPVLARSAKTGNPSLNKDVLDQYEATLPEGNKLEFIRELREKRARDTAVQYLEGYQRYWKPVPGNPSWYQLFSWINPTGADTLRFSSQNPNQQNISKREGFNLRSVFGPLPGREWWALDYQNVELRIPAYEAGEQDLIHVFENPDDPPYYGSYHLVIAELLHPQLFKEHGKNFKKEFESTWYQWIKNGNFAILYGAQEAKADMTYHVSGAYAQIFRRFPKIARLAKKQMDMAERYGYVETIPDSEVCPERGYPILCSRSEWGAIRPTTPLNYHVQSTAMWIMRRAMVECHRYLEKLSWMRGEQYFATIQVHDELVFDFPYQSRRKNLPKVRKLRSLMENVGPAVGVPTPVSISYHPKSWDVSA